jgi:hypothetical protein
VGCKMAKMGMPFIGPEVMGGGRSGRELIRQRRQWSFNGFRCFKSGATLGSENGAIFWRGGERGRAAWSRKTIWWRAKGGAAAAADGGRRRPEAGPWLGQVAVTRPNCIWASEVSNGPHACVGSKFKMQIKV